MDKRRKIEWWKRGDRPAIAAIASKDGSNTLGQRKLPKTAWKPGVSANPGGRPKIAPHVRELARERTEEAVIALTKALKVKNERVPAAKVLLAYAWGNPETTHNIRVIRAIEDLSDDELRALAGLQQTIEGELADEAGATLALREDREDDE